MADRVVRFVLVGDSAGAVRAMEQTAAAADAAGAKVTKAGEKVESFSKRTTKVGAGIAAAGKSLSYLTGGMVLLGGVAVKSALSFQNSMTSIQTQAGATSREVAKMGPKLLALSKHSVFSPQQLAQGLYHLESIGVHGKKAYNDLVVAQKLAMVGNANLEDTTTALGSAWLVNIKGAGNLQHVAAALNATIGAGNMRMDDYVQALGQGLMASAKFAGLGLPDVNAAMAVFTDEGYQASSAAAQFSTALHFFSQPSAKAAKALAAIGIKATQLRDDMHKPHGLLAMMRDLDSHMKGLTRGQKETVLDTLLPGGRGRIMKVLFNQQDRYLMKMHQIQRGTKKFGHDVQVSQRLPLNQLKMAWSGVQAAMIRFGQVLIPVVVPMLMKLAHAAMAVFGWFGRLPRSVKTTVVAFGVLVGVLGPVLLITGKIIESVGKLGEAYNTLKKAQIAQTIASKAGTVATKAMAAAQWLLNVAMDAMPIIAIIAALVAIGVGFVELYKHCKTFRNIVSSVFNWFKRAARDVARFFVKNWKTIALVVSGPLAPLILLITHLKQVKKIVQDIVGLGGKAAHTVGGFLSHPFGLHIALPHFAQGGPVGLVPGTGNRDNVMAMLTPGEFVLRRQVVDALGAQNLQALNRGAVPVAAGAGGPQELVVHAYTNLDGRVLAESVTHYALKLAARK